jgi:transcriptional regulator with XRE-family HTH domain
VPRPEPLLRHLLGATLRDVRTEQGRTLREVSEQARVSMPYLSEVERGRKEASSEVLAAVARALGLRLTDLLAMAWHELASQPQPQPQPQPQAPRDGVSLLAA